MNIDNDVIVNVGFYLWDWLLFVDVNCRLVVGIIGVCSYLGNVEVVFDSSS